MQKIVKQSIDSQLASFSTAGYPPAAVLLSRDKYTELIQELAYDSASDDIEPIAAYDVSNSTISNSTVKWSSRVSEALQAPASVNKR